MVNLPRCVIVHRYVRGSQPLADFIGVNEEILYSWSERRTMVIYMISVTDIDIVPGIDDRCPPRYTEGVER